MKLRFASIALCCLAACATSSSEPVGFEVTITDHPERASFEVMLTSHEADAICLSPEMWPQWNGSFPAAPQTASVIIGEQRFPIERSGNSGFCIGDICATRVEAGASVRADIPYQRFAIPLELHSASKTLSFQPRAYRCED